MKKMTLVILVVTLIASFGFAQDQNLDVSATVGITALSYTSNTDIQIGDVTKSTTATVDPLSGAAHANVGGTTLAGNIAISGEEGATVTVAFDATAVLGNATENMTFTPDVVGHITTQPSAATSLTSGVSTVDLSGTAGGGGTGTYGKIPTMDADGNLGDDDYKFYYGRGPWVRDWNTLIAYNSGANTIEYVDKTAIRRLPGQSIGILRNSINRQSTIGVISKLNYDLSDALKLQAGLDWRTAGIEHAREVRDLLGGDYYLDFADDNGPAGGKKVVLGDIIAYHNNTTVDWLGFFGQGSYSSGPINAYGMAGFSQIAYTYQDHFTVANELIEANAISTMQFKGGAMYDVSDGISVFANFGLVEKPPIMDNVIYLDGTVASDPANEKFQSIEAGVNYQADNMAVKVNYYMTDWKDRNLTKAVSSGEGSSGDTDVIFLTGVNQNHSGLEVEADMQVIDMLRLNASVSLGTWKFTEDAVGNYQEDEFNSLGQVTGQKSTAYTYALKDLFVGDMPQTGMALGATVTPTDGLSIQALFNFYDKNYSDWSPNAREVGSDGTADREQVWMAPSYSKLDVHINYVITGTGMTAFAHVFNALDAVYVQDALDNSPYNGYGDAVSHSAGKAEVFLGTPRYFNAGLKVNF